MLDAPILVPPVPDLPAQEPGAFATLRLMRGNVLQLWPQQAYELPAITRRNFGKTTILLSDPEAVGHVLLRNAANYVRPTLTRRILLPLVGEGLLLSEGAAWKHQRRTIAPLLAPRSMALLTAHVAAAAEDGVARIAGQSGLDLLAAMQSIALEIAGRSMFSLEMASVGGPMRAMLTRFTTTLSRPSFVELMLPRWVPAPLDPARRRFRRDWMALIGGILDARAALPRHAAQDGPRDLFDLLAAARDPETGEGFDRTQLCDQAATMILAGHETTALALFWSLCLLAQSPSWQARVAAEAAAHPFTPETANDALPHLPVTRAVVSEALRLYPPAYMITRRALAADDAAGTAIPSGATVMVAPWVLHRHRRLWAAPDAFDPARFLPGAPAPHRFAFLPFGAGPRVCVAAQFAMAEAVLMLAKLVGACRVAAADAALVRPYGRVTTGPDRPVLFDLERRRDLPAGL